MELYDISVPLSPALPAYPGDPPFALEKLGGDGASVSRLTMTTHSGTHLDVPRHLWATGLAVHEIPLSLLMGPALVAEIKDVREIGSRELRHLPIQGVERLLLKTGSSRLWHQSSFSSDYGALTEEGAAWLLDAGIKLVGIDYLSIEAFPASGRVHEILLGAGVIILEGLDLSAVPPGPYELICLPLPVTGGDGAPARAILRRHSSLRGDTPDLHSSRWPL